MPVAVIRLEDTATCLANACKSCICWSSLHDIIVCILNSLYRCNSGWIGTLCDQCVPTSGCCELLNRNSSEPGKICDGCAVELSDTKTKLVRHPRFKPNIIKCQLSNASICPDQFGVFIDGGSTEMLLAEFGLIFFCCIVKKSGRAWEQGYFATNFSVC